MNIQPPPELFTHNYIIPIFVAFGIILLFSLVKEPYRQTINALIIASAGAIYVHNGLGPIEFILMPTLIFCAYKGLTNYKFVALGWFIHTAWDLLHHFTRNPVLPYMPSSAMECAITDPIIAIWFYYGAPSVFTLFKEKSIT